MRMNNCLEIFEVGLKHFDDVWMGYVGEQLLGDGACCWKLLETGLKHLQSKGPPWIVLMEHFSMLKSVFA